MHTTLRICGSGPARHHSCWMPGVGYWTPYWTEMEKTSAKVNLLGNDDGDGILLLMIVVIVVVEGGSS